jgi:hypothetical protein
MRLNDAFPTKYLKPDDLKGRPATLTISTVTQERIGTDLRLVASFHETQKLLTINRTNAGRIAQLVGSDDTDHWAGKRITILVDQVEFKGQFVPAIRVALPTSTPAPSSAAASSKPATTDPFADNSIPF